jgi:hypothetical protein
MPNYVPSQLSHHPEFELLHEERANLRARILELETKLEKTQHFQECIQRQLERIQDLEAELDATRATLRETQVSFANSDEELTRTRERLRRSDLSNRRLLETLTENEQLYLNEMNAMRRSLLEAQAARRTAEVARSIAHRPRPHLTQEFLRQHPKVIPFQRRQTS